MAEKTSEEESCYSYHSQKEIPGIQNKPIEIVCRISFSAFELLIG